MKAIIWACAFDLVVAGCLSASEQSRPKHYHEGFLSVAQWQDMATGEDKQSAPYATEFLIGVVDALGEKCPQET